MTNKPQFVGERVSFADAFSEVSRGTKKFKQIEYAEIGAHPIVDQGKEAIAGYSDEESGLFADVPAIVFGDHTRCVKYVEEPFFAGADGVKILKPKLPGSTRFWWHALRATPIENLGYSRHFKLLKTATFKVVDEARQKEVVACLDGVLEQISYAEDQLTSFDSLVKSRFVEMFEGGQEWELRTLAECCATSNDIKCGPFGSQLHKEDYVSEGVPVWGIPEVNSNFERMPDKYVSPENGLRLQSYSLVPGDVAMNRKGNVGQAALFDGKRPSGIIHSDVLRVRVNQDVLDPVFLVEQLHSSHVVRGQVLSASTGAIMAGTNVTKLKKIKVFAPPLALQHEFANFVAQVDKSRFAWRVHMQLRVLML